MAHCKPEDLIDLNDVLEEIRSWEKIKEKGFGKFYLKSQGFLHFHTDGIRRWADIRNGENWGTEVDLPINAKPDQKKKFLAEAQSRHSKTLKS